MSQPNNKTAPQNQQKTLNNDQIQLRQLQKAAQDKTMALLISEFPELFSSRIHVPSKSIPVSLNPEDVILPVRNNNLGNNRKPLQLQKQNPAPYWRPQMFNSSLSSNESPKREIKNVNTQANTTTSRFDQFNGNIVSSNDVLELRYKNTPQQIKQLKQPSPEQIQILKPAPLVEVKKEKDTHKQEKKNQDIYVVQQKTDKVEPTVVSEKNQKNSTIQQKPAQVPGKKNQPQNQEFKSEWDDDIQIKSEPVETKLVEKTKVSSAQQEQVIEVQTEVLKEQIPVSKVLVESQKTVEIKQEVKIVESNVEEIEKITEPADKEGKQKQKQKNKEKAQTNQTNASPVVQEDWNVVIDPKQQQKLKKSGQTIPNKVVNVPKQVPKQKESISSYTEQSDSSDKEEETAQVPTLANKTVPAAPTTQANNKTETSAVQSKVVEDKKTSKVTVPQPVVQTQPNDSGSFQVEEDQFPSLDRKNLPASKKQQKKIIKKNEQIENSNYTEKNDDVVYYKIAKKTNYVPDNIATWDSEIGVPQSNSSNAQSNKKTEKPVNNFIDDEDFPSLC